MSKFFGNVKGKLQSAKGKAIAVVGAVTLGATNSMGASADIYGQTIDVSTTEVLLIAGVVIAGSAVIWGIRKSISTTNKS